MVEEITPEEPCQVECYSGYTYAQEPRSFVWRGQRHVVQTVERAWRTPKGLRFRVRTEDGSLYELDYDQRADEWVASCKTNPIGIDHHATNKTKRSRQTKEDQR